MAKVTVLVHSEADFIVGYDFMGGFEVALLEAYTFDVPAGAYMDVIEGWTLVNKFIAEGFEVVFTVAKFPATISFGVLDGGSFVVASVLTISALVSVINVAAGTMRRCGSGWKVGGRIEIVAL